MGVCVIVVRGTPFLHNLNFHHHPCNVPVALQLKSLSNGGMYGRVQSSHQGCGRVGMDQVDKCSLLDEGFDSIEVSNAFPYIQTLRNFPREELFKRIVMVRFDSTILHHGELDPTSPSATKAILTIKYLNEAGAKLILVSSWSEKMDSKVLRVESIADFLSLVLQLKVVTASPFVSVVSKMRELEKGSVLLLGNLSKFREEPANCSKFSEILSLGVDIFVNDAFSQSHKALASTVGVSRFIPVRMAGFHFEDGLYQLKMVAENNKKPYVAIIGGGNFLRKAAAVLSLASSCDGLLFVGMAAFPIMLALGLAIPSNLVENGARKEASDIIQLARHRKIPVLYPSDFWCVNEYLPNQLKLCSSHGILDGLLPVDLGPKSLNDIDSFLLKCKKIIWIGPVQFKSSYHNVIGTSKMAQMLDKLSQNDCDITVVGKVAMEAMQRESKSDSLNYNVVERASEVWEFLGGRKFPAVMALDRAFPFEIDWSAAYCDPAQPLIVDIGSGNGLFLLGMACRRADLNFLGIEINKKLVRRCIDSVRRAGIRNGYFIAANATSTFRSIVSSYPGQLVLVSIQCPNPDFNNPEHRWRMVQRSLAEAVADLLAPDGKVFLQSDIKEVAVRMRELFLKHGKGKLVITNDKGDETGWLNDNPFEVRSDWEQHVLDRGASMHRLMLCKSVDMSV